MTGVGVGVGVVVDVDVDVGGCGDGDGTGAGVIDPGVCGVGCAVIGGVCDGILIDDEGDVDDTSDGGSEPTSVTVEDGERTDVVEVGLDSASVGAVVSVVSGGMGLTGGGDGDGAGVPGAGDAEICGDAVTPFTGCCGCDCCDCGCCVGGCN